MGCGALGRAQLCEGWGLGEKERRDLEVSTEGLKSMSEPQPSLSIVFLLFPTVEPLILILQKEACKVPGD